MGEAVGDGPFPEQQRWPGNLAHDGLVEARVVDAQGGREKDKLEMAQVVGHIDDRLPDKTAAGHGGTIFEERVGCQLAEMGLPRSHADEGHDAGGQVRQGSRCRVSHARRDFGHGAVHLAAALDVVDAKLGDEALQLMGVVEEVDHVEA